MPKSGLITIASRYSVRDTVDRLDAELKSRGIAIFARIDHAAGASSVGMTLRPTELLIFGNPKSGTPLMQAAQTVGIDLPLKMLAWQDADGGVWLTYGDIVWIANRHGIDTNALPQIQAISDLVERLGQAATGSSEAPSV